MSDQIHGRWGHYDIRAIDPKTDIPSILDYLTEHFHSDEPITINCPYDEAFIIGVNTKMAQLLETNGHLCLIATDIRTGTIAALHLQFILSEEQAKHPVNVGEQEQPPPFFQRKVMDSLYQPFDQVKVNIFQKFHVKEVAWNFLVSTSKHHRCQGLSKELFQRKLNLLRRENLSVVFGYYSSPFSRRSAQISGFVELARSRFADAIDPTTGLPFLPHAVGQEDFVSLMALQIK